MTLVEVLQDQEIVNRYAAIARRMELGPSKRPDVVPVGTIERGGRKYTIIHEPADFHCGRR
jgi:hypothetical protein